MRWIQTTPRHFGRRVKNSSESPLAISARIDELPGPYLASLSMKWFGDFAQFEECSGRDHRFLAHFLEWIAQPLLWKSRHLFSKRVDPSILTISRKFSQPRENGTSNYAGTHIGVLK